MPFTQADIDTLDAGRAQGLRAIRFSDGREMQFDSVSDYIKLRNLMVNEVASKTTVRLVKTYTDSGW